MAPTSKLTAFVALAAASPYSHAFAFTPSSRLQQRRASVQLSAREHDENAVADGWRKASGGAAAFLTGMGIMAQVAMADPNAIAPIDEAAVAQATSSMASSNVVLSAGGAFGGTSGKTFETLDFSLPSYDQATSGTVGADLDKPSDENASDGASTASEDAVAAALGAKDDAKKQAQEEKAAKKQAESDAKEAKKQADAEAKEAEAAKAVAKKAAKAERLAADKEKAIQAVERNKAAKEEAAAPKEAPKEEVASQEETAADKEEAPPAVDAVKDTTSSPDIQLPDIKVPDFKVPDFKVPDVKVPDFKVPDFKVPDVKVPAMPDMKSFSLPKVDIPKVDIKVPDFKVPEIKVPEGIKVPDVPAFSMPKVDMPKIDVPAVPKIESYNLDAPKFAAPAPSGSSSADDGIVDEQTGKDVLAAEKKAALKAAEAEVKATEKAAKVAQNKAKGAKIEFKEARRAACETRPGGKLFCVRGFGSGY